MNKIDEKKKELKTFNVKKDIERALKNGAFIMLLALAVEAFTFKEPYSIVTGLFLLSFSFVFFPFLDKLLSLMKIEFNFVNKLFIVIASLVIAAYSIKPEEDNFLKCILPGLEIILTWIVTMIYKKIKCNKYSLRK